MMRDRESRQEDPQSQPALTPPPRVLELVETFDRHREAYRTGSYNESQVRQEFIDPFFEALGWDVRNVQGFAAAYKDVVHEDAIKVGGETKAPDYCFRIGGTRKFFVEAKKPSVKVHGDPGPAYQLRRYAWSAKLPLSILTDFEEFAVYDCRVKPDQADPASKARVLYLTYKDYATRWDEIAKVFSKQAILQGSFDQYAESHKQKHGTAEVDDAFLAEIEKWRDVLARSFALRNRELSARDLNFAVQMTIDRIIFLRMCEDRGIESYGQLRDVVRVTNPYAELHKLFRHADDRYNSGLFHFAKGKGRPEPDGLTPGLTLDDLALKTIIKNLYYPDSPYEFSVIPPEILGHVYEQFLGKVIRLTAGHQAKVEDKPEVKKAGGVYYTPSYIVDYIVEQTVGALLQEKTPKDAARLRILDPACGSGSFLIGAYQKLLDWHRDWYAEHDPKKHTKEMYQGRGGQWLLTSAEKKRILLNNIFGVDIDTQAVEVTKLSLLLKVLETESRETIENQPRLFRERALPDLDGNIQCGNSLIGPDFYDDSPENLSDEERYRLNVFDWNKAFPEIMKQGGFDAVIGNPPYLNIDDTWGKGDSRQRYIKRRYMNVYSDKTDILFYFLAKAIELSRGEVGYIVSRAFLEAYKADKLRSWIAKHSTIREIIDFRDYNVFRGVGITTALIFLSKTHRRSRASFYRMIHSNIVPENLAEQKADRNFFGLVRIAQQSFAGVTPWVFADPLAQKLLDKIDNAGNPLGSVLIVGQGMQTGCNGVFGGLEKKQLDLWRVKKDQRFIRARNSDIQRYVIRDSDEYLLYVEDVPAFKDLPAGVQEHLRTCEAQLKERAAFKRGDCDWWRYTWPLHKELLPRRKLLCPYLATFNRFALDEDLKFLGLTDTTVLFDSAQPEELRYILGLLNSRLLTFRFRYIGKLKSGGIIEYFWNTISKLPLRRIDFNDERDTASHDRVVGLVERMLTLQKQLTSAKTPPDRTNLQSQIDATDRQIDPLVYELYGLTEDEIAIVEG
jgi:N-6 DNA Methylase/TaqI-like C-terminal specificity domain/Type I restriction enzyme R protein N terminus (HSDR_N)